MRWSFSPTNEKFFFVVSLKCRDKLSTKQKKFRYTRDTVWHEFLIITIFAIFPAIRKNNFPQKINGNIFPAKIYSRVLSILLLKFTTRKYSTKKSCLFNYNLPLSFRNKTVYNEILVLHRVRTPWYCLKILFLVFTKSVDSDFRAFWLAPRNSEYPWIFTVLRRDSKWLLVSRQFPKMKF